MDIKGLDRNKKEFIDEFFEDEIDGLEGKKLRKFYHNKKMSVCNEDSILNKTYEMWLYNKNRIKKLYDEIYDLKHTVDQRSFEEGSRYLEKNIEYWENRWGLKMDEWNKIVSMDLEN